VSTLEQRFIELKEQVNLDVENKDVVKMKELINELALLKEESEST
jgi:hypothetical protein